MRHYPAVDTLRRIKGVDTPKAELLRLIMQADHELVYDMLRNWHSADAHGAQRQYRGAWALFRPWHEVVRGAFTPDDWADARMALADAVIAGHGAEELWLNGHTLRYVNLGTYEMTLLLRGDSFQVGAWGDVVEGVGTGD